MKTAAIVLAAGKSSRMGTNKLLLKVGDKMILEHVLFKLKPYTTIVVTGYNPEEISPIIHMYKVVESYNPDYEKGMTTSFQTGLKQLGSEIKAVFLVLSDTFGFNQELLKIMTDKMESDQRVLLVSPEYKGKHGHPVLVKRPLFEEFLELSCEDTMKDIVDRHKEEHEYVQGDLWCTIDLDTLQDYEKVKKLWEANCS